MCDAFTLGMTKNIRHDELTNGDKVWNTGYLFEINNVRQIEWTDEHGNIHIVTRYEGKIVDPTSDLKGTGYDGGTYGARGDILATVEV
jgi:hypothetical protein